MGMISPGIKVIRVWGVGISERGSAADAAICAARLPPHGMANQNESPRVGPNMSHTGMQNSQGIANRLERIGQEVLRQRSDVVLIPREYDDFAIANQVVDPGAIKPWVDGEPAVEKHDYRARSSGIGLSGSKIQYDRGPCPISYLLTAW